MQKRIIPLANIQTEDLSLPVVLYQATGLKVTLKSLSRAEVEEKFGIRIIDNGDGSYTSQGINILNSAILGGPELLNELAASSMQLLLEADSNLIGRVLQKNVDFAIKFALGRGDDIVAAYTEVISGGGWGLQRSGSTTTSTRRSQMIALDEKIVNRLKLALSYAYSDNPKFSTISALLNAAMQQPGAVDVSCTFYFSLLEALYIQDDDHSEITYKLSLRITKKNNKDFEFFKKIKKLYGKRSKVIHGGRKGNVFEREEHEFLEGLVIETLDMYFQNPNDFNADSLDRLLLH